MKKKFNSLNEYKCHLIQQGQEKILDFDGSTLKTDKNVHTMSFGIVHTRPNTDYVPEKKPAKKKTVKKKNGKNKK